MLELLIVNNLKNKIMKLKYLLFILIISNQFVQSQITPVETIIKGKRTTYRMNSYHKYDSIFKSQPDSLMFKLSENRKMRPKLTVNISSISNCISQSNLNILKSDNRFIAINYIIDRNGIVLSCQFLNYNDKVQLSVSEAECILTNAMQHSIFIENIPADVLNNFYQRVSKLYRF